MFPDIIEQDDKETIAQLQSQVADLTTKINEITDTLKEHKHSGSDGSEVIDQSLEIRSPNSIKLGYGEVGSYIVNPGVSLDSATAGGEAFQTSISVGKDIGDLYSTGNAQLSLIHYAKDTTTYYSYLTGARPPYYVSPESITITNGGNTLTSTKFSWTTNELAGAYVNIIHATTGAIETRTIASNTSTIITISGTWTSATASYYYIIWRPMYLGWSTTPWKRLYVDESNNGGIRFGVGSTGNGQNGLLYMDSTGDLYWRDKASTATKLNGAGDLIIFPYETKGNLSAGFTLTPDHSFMILSAVAARTSSTTNAIDSIAGATIGQMIVLQGSSNTYTITIKDGANTQLAGDCTLGNNDTLTLIWNGGDWVEVSRSNN